ncbi:MAG: TolC family protein [Vicinamibacterales bacterium]
MNTLSQRVREGITAEADLRKFETEHQRLIRQATRTDITARSALLRLSATLGVNLRFEQLVPVAMGSAALPAQVDVSHIMKRPDVVAAQARVERAEAVLAVERARGVPDVLVTTGYKRTSGFDTGLAGITVPINLFDRNRVAIAFAVGDVSAAKAELERIQQIARSDAQAHVTAALRLTDQAASARQELIEPAAIVREAARASYVEGRGDVLQLVDAERVFAEASRDAIELGVDALLACIHARLSLGEDPLP